MSTNWLSTNVPCDWYGVTCSDVFPASVIGLTLAGNNLSGSIPAQLAHLPNVLSINLRENSLSGPVPSALGALWQLVELDLAHNHLTGSVPDELLSIGNLRVLDLSYNEFTGGLPPGLATTNIMWSCGSRDRLSWLSLAGNRLTGPVPTAIAAGGPLDVLDVSANALSGFVPALPVINDFGARDNMLTPCRDSVHSLCALGWNNTDVFDPYWRYYQTIQPWDVAVSALDSSSARVTWTALAYNGTAPGYYEIGLAASPGGLYEVVGATTGIDARQYDVTNLVPGQTYHFAVRMHTQAHDWQQNSLTSQYSVDAPYAYTQVGEAVSVVLDEDVSLVFGGVIEPGSTIVTTSGDVPAAPASGFDFLGDYYDVVTTATFDSTQGIDITIGYDDTGMTSDDESAIALLHFENGEWVDCTIGRDTNANTVTGHVSSLSWLALAFADFAVGPIVAPVLPQQLGTMVDVSATTLSRNSLSTVTGLWSWGDGTTSQATLSAGVLTGSHDYGQVGVYTVQLTAAATGYPQQTRTYRYVVIFDPEQGFVTGGGWIYSAAGACWRTPACKSAEGRANFGFVSRYEHGANRPTGNTEFQFHSGDLSFHSATYDWLVVAGSKAIYKGSGTINGNAGYDFLLSAVDGGGRGSQSSDLFRIKIWDSATQSVVYDNQLGASDTADPTTRVLAGGIVVHR